MGFTNPIRSRSTWKKSRFPVPVVLFFLFFLNLRAEAWMSSRDLDSLIRVVWEAHGIQPASPVSDAEFLRRVSLDLVGEPPGISETVAFLQSRASDKRNRLVDHLLDSPQFGEYHATMWMDLIGAGKNEKKNFPMESFQTWFEERFNKDKPFDETVRQLITASGTTKENGATYLIVSHRGNQADLVGTTSRLFLGTRLQCCQCHDDKFGDWKQKDFWGLAAFFARVRVSPDEKTGNRIVSVRVADLPRGEAIIPEGGILPDFRSLSPDERKKTRKALMLEQRTHPVPPRFLGRSVSLNRFENRREVLGRLITSPHNTLFAKTIVNRVWSEMFGRGLIEPVDDIYGKKAGDWERVLDRLATEFVQSGYSLKHLYRLITGSEAYQCTSKGQTEYEDRIDDFAQARLRALSPKVLFTTILKTTGIENTIDTRFPRERLEHQKNRYMERFVVTFGNDEGNAAESFEGTIPQALMMMNDFLITRGITPLPGSTLRQILETTEDPEERIRLIYLAVLCREPTAGEISDCLAYLGNSLRENRQASLEETGPSFRGNRFNRPGGFRFSGAVGAYEDLFWVLMNSTEFLYNH